MSTNVEEELVNIADLPRALFIDECDRLATAPKAPQQHGGRARFRASTLWDTL
jgi:hypothetical protein